MKKLLYILLLFPSLLVGQIAIGVGVGVPFQKPAYTRTIVDWILYDGTWHDEKTWNDSQFWKDN